jgi:ABC-type multidrug transport system fused ATPase/permease subunit
LHKILLKIHYYLYLKGKTKYLLFLFFGLFSVIFETFRYLSIVPLITVLINPDYLSQSSILLFLKSIIQSSNDYDFIIRYGLICILIFIFGSIFSFIHISLQVRFINSIILNTRQGLLKNYLNKDLSFHKNNNTTNLISKLFTQIDEMGTSVVFGVFEFVNSAFLVIIFLSLLSLADWKLTLSALIFLSIFYFLIEINLKKKLKIQRKYFMKLILKHYHLPQKL